jgi:hypothetical protein
LVRATLEAGGYTAYVGVGQSYPGYARAVALLTDRIENSDQPAPGLRQYVARRPSDSPNLKLRPLTSYLHITAYSASNTQVSAVVCGYTIWPEQLRGEDDRYEGGGIRIELQNTSSDPGLPGIANRDLDNHDPRAHVPPKWDVFGTWNVTVFQAPANDGEDLAECLPWYQEQFPTFTKTTKYNYLQAPPGYVAPHHPVAPEYPEWIGPSNPG